MSIGAQPYLAAIRRHIANRSLAEGYSGRVVVIDMPTANIAVVEIASGRRGAMGPGLLCPYQWSASGGVYLAGSSGPLPHRDIS